MAKPYTVPSHADLWKQPVDYSAIVSNMSFGDGGMGKPPAAWHVLQCSTVIASIFCMLLFQSMQPTQVD